MVAVVLGRVVVLVVERRVPRSSMHHLRLTVHHVPRHRTVRGVRPTGSCVRRKHYQGVTFLLRARSRTLRLPAGAGPSPTRYHLSSQRITRQGQEPDSSTTSLL